MGIAAEVCHLLTSLPIVMRRMKTASVTVQNHAMVPALRTGGD